MWPVSIVARRAGAGSIVAAVLALALSFGHGSWEPPVAALLLIIAFILSLRAIRTTANGVSAELQWRQPSSFCSYGLVRLRRYTQRIRERERQFAVLAIT